MGGITMAWLRGSILPPVEEKTAWLVSTARTSS
jgi:hypothetical protein